MEAKNIMKITKQYLKQIIKEELQRIVLKEENNNETGVICDFLRKYYQHNTKVGNIIAQMISHMTSGHNVGQGNMHLIPEAWEPLKQLFQIAGGTKFDEKNNFNMREESQEVKKRLNLYNSIFSHSGYIFRNSGLVDKVVKLEDIISGILSQGFVDREKLQQQQK
jgi:hypothetical protein